MSDSITPIQQCLERLRAGDPAARKDLLQHTYRRLEQLTHNRRHQFAALEETGDILNDVILRLDLALRTVQPDSVAGFFAIASQHVRWVLLNAVQRRAPNAEDQDRVDSAAGPATQFEAADLLSRLHREVERLPPELRQVIDLLFYQQFTQAEAADILGVDVRTVRRHWRKARESLFDALGGQMPREFREYAEGQI